MFREVLKSKLHRAMITGSDVDYEGSIEIPTDLMEAADLWPGEKVLVASITTGARLETYVLAGKPRHRPHPHQRRRRPPHQGGRTGGHHVFCALGNSGGFQKPAARREEQRRPQKPIDGVGNDVDQLRSVR